MEHKIITILRRVGLPDIEGSKVYTGSAEFSILGDDGLGEIIPANNTPFAIQCPVNLANVKSLTILSTVDAEIEAQTADDATLGAPVELKAGESFILPGMTPMETPEEWFSGTDLAKFIVTNQSDPMAEGRIKIIALFDATP